MSSQTPDHPLTSRRFAIIPEVIWQTADPHLILVYGAIALHANGGGTAFPAVNTLVRLTGLSRRTVQRSIVRLREAMLISAESQPGSPNLYLLTPEPVSIRQEVRQPDTGVRQPDTGGASDGRRGCVTQTPKQYKLTKPENNELFDRFWRDYPHYSGRSSRKLSKAIFTALPAEEQLEILTVLPRWAESPDWNKDHGAFVPGAQVWLRQRKWETPINVVTTDDAFWKRMV